MKRRLDVLRREGPDRAPYWQSFLYETEDGTETVATALTRLNERTDLRDLEGRSARPVRWACSCLQKKCGACAMVIDGRPALACNARLSDLGERIRLEPLRKFPPVADLIADRSVLYENLKTLRLWLEEAPEEAGGDQAYEASRCLQCGCCLEVCPNFDPEGAFTGMAAAVPFARLLAEAGAGQRRKAARAYRTRFYNGCGKSLSCRGICPAEIDIDGLLVNSNAIAVWKRLFGRRRK